jgi:signal peptidase I
MKAGSTTLPGPVLHGAGPSGRDIEAHALFEEARKRRRHRRRLFGAIIGAVVVAAVAVIGGRALVGHSAATANTEPPRSGASSRDARFYVEQSGAMEPTLRPGDRIGVVTRYGVLRRGDVVVFYPPADSSQGAPLGSGFRIPEIKRIIGLPGETVSASGATTFINGRPLSEPYLAPGALPGSPVVTQVIPAGHYFVMGDNRDDTADSRFYGPIPARSVIGVASTIVAPPSRAGPISGQSS